LAGEVVERNVKALRTPPPNSPSFAGLTPITPFDAALYQPATVESAEAICLSTFTLIAERSQKASDPGSRRALDQ